MKAESEGFVVVAHAPGDVRASGKVTSRRIPRGTSIEDALAGMAAIGMDEDSIRVFTPSTLAAKATALRRRAEDRSGLLAAEILLGVTKARHALRHAETGQYRQSSGDTTALRIRRYATTSSAVRYRYDWECPRCGGHRVIRGNRSPALIRKMRPTAPPRPHSPQ